MSSEYFGPEYGPATSMPPYQEQVYREHVSGTPASPPSEAPRFRPAPPAYPPAPPQLNPYYYPIPPFGSYQYAHPMPSPKPKRDRYLFVISLLAFIGSLLMILAGLGSAVIAFVLAVLPTQKLNLTPDQHFSGNVIFIVLTLVGTIGGGYSLYHSICSLFLRKSSSAFKLPWFWTFLIVYIVVLIVGVTQRNNGMALSSLAGAILLIALAGILPSLTVLALGLRRIHFPRMAPWPTTWRRFTLALVSGATLSIALAGLLEVLLEQNIVTWLGVKNFSLNDPTSYDLQDPQIVLLFFIMVAIIAPLVEESVKPFAAVLLIRRVSSASEAFVLGLASGIGFNLVETSGYISQGYSNWVDIAIERSTTGLLHGFGAAMVTLGWYYLTHRKTGKYSVLLALACWGYAIVQHALWNGSFVLQLLPDPIGPFLSDGSIQLGTVALPAFALVYIMLAVLMLTFFIYVTGKLRNSSQQVQRTSGAA